MVRITSSVTALALGSAASVFAGPTAGGFNALTLNVAGLPPILNNNNVPGDKTANSREIGRLLSQYNYDIVHMQEDFNFHAAIYETNKHPYRTPTSGGVPFGSGLNTVTNFPWNIFSRIKWKDCAIGSGDCLTPKGFTAMRLRVSEGVYIDVYNLHADAGSDAPDQAAKTSNFKQVANYIDSWSTGNAVLVFGDTNARYTRPGDSITTFQTQSLLKDAWVELIRGGVNPTEETGCSNPSTTNNCEIVDKLFYRGSKLLDLKATRFNYDSSSFLQADGSILTDHNAVAVNFTWTLNPSLRQSDFFGGNGGNYFNDIPALPSSPKLSTLTFVGANRLDSIALMLSSGQIFQHGGSGGSPKSLTLAAGEYWVKTRLCQGEKNGRTSIFYILATTSTGRTLSQGVSTGNCADFQAEAGWAVVGLTGQTGDEVDQLGLVYGRQ